MSDRRIVSLAPSVTATLAAADAAGGLVGVTHHCDADAPVVGGWTTPDVDAVLDADPDLVLTCDPLQRDVRDDLRDRGVDVVHREPATLADVLACFEDVLAAVGAAGAGARLRADAEARLDAVHDAVADAPRPVVYCEEWSDPPMAAGNWVPDAVHVAGGRYPFVDAGERSREVSRAEVEAADPDHAVLHVCGRGDRVSPSTVTDRAWGVSPAVHVVDDSLLNQPSPRLLDGVEALAARLHPDRVAAAGVADPTASESES